jgi:hypothetical protein
MMKKTAILALTAAVLIGLIGTHIKAASTDPDISALINEVSKENVEKILKKLESFQTRHVMSSDKEGFGIKASAEWLLAEFKRLSPSLQVEMDTYELPPQGRRMTQPMTMRNVVAILPGRHTGEQERIFMLHAHYDSYARPVDKDWPRGNFDNLATGVNDDSSGVAALLELARVFSEHEFDATVIFVAFAGEEVGLVGSTLMAARLKEAGKNVCGNIGLDMIGNIESGNGAFDNRRMRVFSAGPMDSPSRSLARYAKRVGEYYMPSAEIDLIYRADRFGRGGDHTPFVLEGWAGIRMMEANENYSRQHTVNDTFANMDLDYCTRNIRIVGSVLASLAAAPPSPSVTSDRGRALLGRGVGYDAALKWNPVVCNDLAGYVVHWRRTTSPHWEKTIHVGNVTEHTLPDVTIDEYVFGVSAVDTGGNHSVVSAYVMPPRTKRTYEVKK